MSDKKAEARGAFAAMRKREEQESRLGSTVTPVPCYQSHKKVWALKLREVHLNSDAAGPNEETDGSAILVPAESGFAPFRVDREYVQKHNPAAGGYFVQYKDGYKSWSPAEAFEEGHTRI